MGQVLKGLGEGCHLQRRRWYLFETGNIERVHGAVDNDSVFFVDALIVVAVDSIHTQLEAARKESRRFSALAGERETAMAHQAEEAGDRLAEVQAQLSAMGTVLARERERSARFSVRNCAGRPPLPKLRQSRAAKQRGYRHAWYIYT